MVRSRLQIGEEDRVEAVAERLAAGLERWISDPGDREFIAPRLGQLLGLPTGRVLAKEELFSGWRLFFERLAEHLPVVMVVEDLQWADAGFVDFLDHLLEWSGDHAIFLLVLTRPEGTELKGLGLSRRNVTTLALDRLSDEVMADLLDGLVTGLPLPARSRIVERADGIPLYAIETVRGLLDKGVVAKADDGTLHLVGELGELETPPGLTALISSRLDALDPDERQLVKECSVLGGSFPRQAVAALSDVDPALIDDVLSSLVRKEVLTVRADRFSPERGQYAFTQSLIRSVAYDMLTRAERRARHLKTAAHLRTAFPDEGAEVAEVIAAHLHDAYRAAGDDPDAELLRAQAKGAYVARRRESPVGRRPRGGRSRLPDRLRAERGRGREDIPHRDGREDGLVGRSARPRRRAFRGGGRGTQGCGTDDRGRPRRRLARAAASRLGRGEQSIVVLREALASLELEAAPPSVVADLQEKLGGSLIFSGHLQEAAEPIEHALLLAQHYELADTLAAALVSRALLLHFVGRYEEARLGHEGSLEMARRLGMSEMEMRAEGNLADLCMTRDIPGAEEHCRSMLALAGGGAPGGTRRSRRRTSSMS